MNEAKWSDIFSFMTNAQDKMNFCNQTLSKVDQLCIQFPKWYVWRILSVLSVRLSRKLHDIAFNLPDSICHLIRFLRFYCRRNNLRSLTLPSSSMKAKLLKSLKGEVRAQYSWSPSTLPNNHVSTIKLNAMHWRWQTLIISLW